MRGYNGCLALINFPIIRPISSHSLPPKQLLHNGGGIQNTMVCLDSRARTGRRKFPIIVIMPEYLQSKIPPVNHDPCRHWLALYSLVGCPRFPGVRLTGLAALHDFASTCAPRVLGGSIYIWPIFLAKVNLARMLSPPFWIR